MIAWPLLTMALLQAAAGSSPVEGVWKASYTTSEARPHAFTLTLKVEDSAVSGTLSSPRGSVPITKGSIDGRDIAFVVTRKSSYDVIDVTYRATVSGDEMRLTMKVGAREPIVFTARRDPSTDPAGAR